MKTSILRANSGTSLFLRTDEGRQVGVLVVDKKGKLVFRKAEVGWMDELMQHARKITDRGMLGEVTLQV